MERVDGRAPEQMRTVSIISGVNPYAEGSAEVGFGKTRVLVTASVERDVPDWMKERGEGWITAEYGMLPRSTHTRNRREASAGKQSGRTLEIQRLIGRALRAAVDLKSLGPITLRFDCDVICADGGTRTAAISGAWVALREAIAWAAKNGVVSEMPRLSQVAAVSLGMLNTVPLLDLCYAEDSSADFDLNLVFTERGEIVEIQGTAERRLIPPKDLMRFVDLGFKGAEVIFAEQRRACGY